MESAEAVELATRLAALTQQSLPAVVIDAFRQRLEAEERRLQDVESRKQRILTAAKELREAFIATGEPLPSSDHDRLYDDETGLPI